MRKFLLLILLATPAFAGGPKSTFPQPRGLDAEMVNIYHDIANPVINIGTASTMTITQLNVSSIAVTGQIDMRNKKIINLANGVASTDAAAFGQLTTSGRVVKMSSACVTASASTTSSSFANSNLAGTITPSSNTSLIRITATGPLTGNGTNNCYATLANGSTNLAGSNGLADEDNGVDHDSTLFLYNSPATTSATTYNVMIRSGSAGVLCNWNRISVSSCITLEEVSQ